MWTLLPLASSVRVGVMRYVKPHTRIEEVLEPSPFTKNGLSSSLIDLSFSDIGSSEGNRSLVHCQTQANRASSGKPNRRPPVLSTVSLIEIKLVRFGRSILVLLGGWGGKTGGCVARCRDKARLKALCRFNRVCKCGGRAPASCAFLEGVAGGVSSSEKAKTG